MYRCLCVLVLAASLVCTACGDGKNRKPTFPVQGQVFAPDGKKPAAHALVIFHPLHRPEPENWPEGYPRATAAADGTFKLTTYSADDGAPAGEYAVLIQWARQPVAEDEEGELGDAEDRFEGRFSNPEKPRWRRQVQAGGNDPKTFHFILR